MALYSQPMYQQAMQKARSKASMRGNRAKTSGLQSRLAEMDLARKMAFKSLSLQRKRADLSHAGRAENLRVASKDLKERKEQLPWQIGIGAGTSLLSGLEGRRRANLIKKQEQERQWNFDQMMNKQISHARRK